MGVGRLLVANVWLFALVVSRIAGFVVVSPFPGPYVGVTQRVGLVVVLAWIACSFAPAGVAPALGHALVGHVVVELGCGLILGFAFRAVFSAGEVLGDVLGQTTGIGSGSVINPTLGAPDTALGRIVALASLLIALAMGVHRIAIAGLLASFRALPVGTGFAPEAPLLHSVDLGIDAFVVGVRLATPVIAVSLLVHAALAMISRAAPSLQIFSVGFAILFASSIATLLVSLDDIGAGLIEHFGGLASVMDHLLPAMHP